MHKPDDGEGNGLEMEDEAPSLPSKVALRARWDPDVGLGEACAQLTRSAANAVQGGDLSNIVARLGRSPGAVEELCCALRLGRHDAAETVCAHGAVEATMALLSDGKEFVEADTTCFAFEALWLMIDDYDSCQPLIQGGGHDKVLRLAREQGPQDASVARGAFRLLAETLYNEAQNAALWCSADFNFLVDALEWALRVNAEPHRNEDEANMRAELLATMCDVTTLWAWRVTGPSAESVKLLMGIIPRVLEEMAARPYDGKLLQHGCRLLNALAKRGVAWPEDLRRPAQAALTQIIGQCFLGFNDPSVQQYSRLALKAVDALPVASLSAMD